MARDEPSLGTLRGLAQSDALQDRAFAAGALRLHCRAETRAESRAEAAAIYERIREAANTAHARVRASISAGTLDQRALLAELHATPLELRDHLLEEILGIAYPPLTEHGAPREAFPPTPSGLAEILFLLERSELEPSKSFVDLGSGFGKVVLLVAMLSGARAYGLELDRERVVYAQAAASALALDNARFSQADVLRDPPVCADVYYMFVPTLRSVDAVARLQPIAADRKILLFSQALDLRRLAWLRACDAASYWLEMYESR